MRLLAVVLVLGAAGCVTSGTVEDAQFAALKCHQRLRAQQRDDDPGAADTRDRCEELDLRAQQLDARHERQREALRQMSQNQHQHVRCTSNSYGNTTQTDCEE
jgi:hypothetical protein